MVLGVVAPKDLSSETGAEDQVRPPPAALRCTN